MQYIKSSQDNFKSLFSQWFIKKMKINLQIYLNLIMRKLKLYKIIKNLYKF